MKTIKFNKKIQIILITIFVLALSTTIVGILANNKIMASDLAPECPNCGTSQYMKCTKNNEQQHTWTCENEGCDYSLQEEHVNGTHQNNGHCQACGYQYQEHKIVSDDTKYYSDDSTDMKTYHWKYNPCAVEGCTYHYNIAREVHSGGEQCESGGICQFCGVKYIEHKRSDEIERYVVTNDVHIPVYRCVVEGCENIFLAEEEAESHSLEYKGLVPNEDGKTHSKLYVCSFKGCNYEETSLEQEDHINGSHENDGHCQACGYQYQEHKIVSDVTKYYLDDSNDMKTYHWEYNPCAVEGCTYQYNITRGTHSGGEQCESGGICQYCGVKYIEHNKSDEIERYIVTNDVHIPVYRCVVEGCENIFLAEEEAESHSLEYKGLVPNGDGKTHSELYVCSVEGCNYEETSFANLHVFTEKYKDNGDGTHSQTCQDCGYVKTEEHTEVIEEGKAATCTEKGLTEGKHCSVCNAVIVAQEEIPAKGHNYVEGVCTECGETKAQEEIEITSKKYELDDKYISKIQPETTVSELKANLETNVAEINIYNKNNELVNDTDKLGTGMKIELKNGEQKKTFIIIVEGDTDGDGTVGMIDITTINKYRLNKKNLDEEDLKAGDVTGDGKVDFYDILKINKFRLHKITEL